MNTTLGYIPGTLRFDDSAAKVRARPVVSCDAKEQRRFIMDVMRPLERVHNGGWANIEGAVVRRSIGGGFTVTCNGETLRKSAKTIGAIEAVAVWIWERINAKQEAA